MVNVFTTGIVWNSLYEKCSSGRGHNLYTLLILTLINSDRWHITEFCIMMPAFPLHTNTQCTYTLDTIGQTSGHWIQLCTSVVSLVFDKCKHCVGAH